MFTMFLSIMSVLKKYTTAQVYKSVIDNLDANSFYLIFYLKHDSAHKKTICSDGLLDVYDQYLVWPEGISSTKIS